MSDTTYRGRDGATLTAQQVVQEFRKARLVAGQPTSGPEYDAALKQWFTTYDVVTPAEKRASSAFSGAFMIGLVTTVVLAVLSAFLGGPIAFVIVAVLGFIGALGFAAIVSLFMTPSKPSTGLEKPQF